MAPASAMPRPDFGEVQLRIPPLPERALLTEWLTDALTTELHQQSSVVDDVEDDGDVTCVYLHGQDVGHLVEVARRLVTECGWQGIRIIETRPGPEEWCAA